MQYFVFGAVWLALVIGGFLVAGPASAANLKSLNAKKHADLSSLRSVTRVQAVALARCRRRPGSADETTV